VFAATASAAIRVPATLHVPWLYASDGAGLADKLEQIGLLEQAPQQPEIEA
jgi:hypothetical protein